MKLYALALAQLQDLSRNPMLLLFLSLVPIIGVAMKAAMPASAHTYLATLLFVMAAYFIGWNLPAHTLAEEKEKRVLESLFLTPVRPWQLVLVKGALGTLFTLVFGLLLLLIMGGPARPGLWFACYLVLTLFTVAGGTLTGLLVRDMRTLGAGGTPVLLLLLFASVLPWGVMQPTFWAVQAWLPTRPALELMQAGYAGDAVPVLRNVLVMLGYTAALWLLNARLIRRLAFAAR